MQRMMGYWRQRVPQTTRTRRDTGAAQLQADTHACGCQGHGVRHHVELSLLVSPHGSWVLSCSTSRPDSETQGRTQLVQREGFISSAFILPYSRLENVTKSVKNFWTGVTRGRSDFQRKEV